jgi:hypothetical protein
LHLVHDWDPIRLIGYNEKPHKMHIENNGHTAKITVTPEDCKELPQVHYLKMKTLVKALSKGVKQRR